MFNSKNMAEMITIAEKAYLLARLNNLDSSIVEAYRENYYNICHAAPKIEAEQLQSKDRARALLGLKQAPVIDELSQLFNNIPDNEKKTLPAWYSTFASRFEVAK